jgi:hypothetical protein
MDGINVWFALRIVERPMKEAVESMAAPYIADTWLTYTEFWREVFGIVDFKDRRDLNIISRWIFQISGGSAAVRSDNQ